MSSSEKEKGDEQQSEQAWEDARTSLLSSLLSHLEVVTDPRQAQGKRHPLINVLSIAVFGTMCGCNDAEALEDWGNKEKAWLGDFLVLLHGIPSQDVFLRVLSLLDPEQFRGAFASWMVEVFRIMGMRGQLAVDGQTLRRSHDRGKGQKAVHMLHGLWCETGLVVAQKPTDAKSNEITAIPELLKLLSLEGTLVSLDAMGTQVAIAKQIRKQGGDYLLALKGNQDTLSKEVKQVFQEARDSRKRNEDEAQPPVIQRATEVDKGHGRLETRTAEVITDFGDWIPESSRWTDLRTLVAIVARREDLTTGHVSEETRYYICSAALSPTSANEATRKHWRVENGLHYRLDVTFQQDSCRTRTLHAAENLAVIRHFVVNVLRNFRGDKYSMPRRRRLCDYDPAYRSRVLRAAIAP